MRITFISAPSTILIIHMIVLLLIIAGCLAHTQHNCTHSYHIHTIKQPHFFKIDVNGTKPTTFCIVTPKWNVTTKATMHFNHYNCLFYNQRVDPTYTTDNSTVYVGEVRRGCQRSKMWKYRDHQPGANLQDFVVAIKETVNIYGINAEWSMIKMILLIIFMIAALFKPVYSLIFCEKSPFVIKNKEQ